MPENVMLKDAEVGKQYRIVRVDHRHKELVDYFMKLKMKLNQKIEFHKNMAAENRNKNYSQE